MTTTSANDILMGGGGSFASFKIHGDTIAGTITNIGEPYQQREWNQATQRADGPPKFTKAGKPVWAFHITLATDEKDPSNPEDDGTRVLDVNAWRMQDAIRNAIRGVGGLGLEVGARLTVSYTEDEVPGDPRSGKHYQATYVRSTNAALMGDTPAAPAAQPVAQTPAPAVAPAAATPPPAAGAVSPADQAKQLINLGLDDTTIATNLGLDPTVVAMIRTAA